MVYADYVQNLDGKHDKHNKNSYFFATTEPNRMGFSAKCRFLVIILKNPKVYLDRFIILKVIDAESLVSIFIGTICIRW